MNLEVKESKCMERFQTALEHQAVMFGDSLEQTITKIGALFSHIIHAMNSLTKQHRSENDKLAAKIQKELVKAIQSVTNLGDTAGRIGGAVAGNFVKGQAGYKHLHKHADAGMSTVGGYIKNLSESERAALQYAVSQAQALSNRVDTEMQNQGQRETEIKQSSDSVEEKRFSTMRTLVQ